MSEDTLHEISSWKKNIFKVFKPIRYPKISIAIYTDGSIEAWGASMGNVSIGETWLPDEKLMHINVLELKAILLALKSFVKTSHKYVNPLNAKCHHVETSQLICAANQLAGFYMMTILAFNGLKSYLTIPQQSTALTKWQFYIQWNVIIKF